MKCWTVAWLALLSVVLVGCSSTTAPKDTSSKPQPDLQVAQLTAQLSAARAQRDELTQEINRMNQEMTAKGPLANEELAASGHGDGRFVVAPKTVAQGGDLAIFSDIAGGEVRILSKDLKQTVAKLTGPESHDFVLYTIPRDLSPGEYHVVFQGHGGTTGEATISVVPPGSVP